MLENQWQDGNFNSGEYKIKNARWVIQTVERKEIIGEKCNCSWEKDKINAK